MKKIFLISFLSFFISSTSYSQSKFPQCKGTDFSKFNNCYAKINLGDKNVVYDGEFKNGKFHGQGILIDPLGTKYAGEWKNGMPDGKGTLTDSDGTKFIGEWKNGKKDGSGTYIFTNGKTKQGIFKDGNLVEKWKKN